MATSFPLVDDANLATTESPLARYARGIDHLGIAVRDLEAGLKWFTNILGFTVTERHRTAGTTTGMVWAVLRAGNLTIVLAEGTNPESQISRFIEQYGPGVQHVAVRVDDIETAVRDLTAGGLEFETPIIGNGGLRQAFSRRDATSGLMVEIIERTVEGFADANVSELFQT